MTRGDLPSAVCRHTDLLVGECIAQNGCRDHRDLKPTRVRTADPGDRCCGCNIQEGEDSGGRAWWQLGDAEPPLFVCGGCAEARRTAREPGIYAGISDVEYHADRRSLSSSGARKLLPPSTPAEFRWAQDHPTPPSRAFDHGHAAHALMLGVGAELREVPGSMLASNGALSTKAAKEFVAQARKDGAVPLKPDDYRMVHDMADAQKHHPLAAALFSEGIAEQSGYWVDDETGVQLRFRPDWRTQRGGQVYCVDYKTAVTANPAKFQASVAEYGYHLQDDFYRRGLAALGIADDAIMLFVVQAKTPPYLVSVVQLSPDATTVGAQLNRQAIDLYAWCTETGEWPGYSNEIHQIDLPPWSYR